MKKCKTCGFEHPDNAVFCMMCGSKFESDNPNLIKCPSCGKEVSVKADRCPFCGAPIASELPVEPRIIINGIRIEDNVQRKEMSAEVFLDGEKIGEIHELNRTQKEPIIVPVVKKSILRIYFGRWAGSLSVHIYPNLETTVDTSCYTYNQHWFVNATVKGPSKFRENINFNALVFQSK